MSTINKLTPDFIASLPKGWRGEKVDAERRDLSIVMPAQTWHMKVEGKRVRIPGPVHDAKLYDRDAAIAEIDRLNAPEPEPQPVGPVTLGYALEAWKDRQFNKPRAGKPRLRDGSKKAYGSWLKHIENWRINKRPATDMLLDAITDLDCEDLQDELADRPPTANYVIARLRAIYKFARRKRWTIYDPTLGLDRLPVDPFQPILSKSEHQQLISALWNSTSPARWPLLLDAVTGCRCAEAANISASEIVGDKWMIPADRMKGRKPHTYYLKSAQMQLIARNAAGWKTDINKSNAARWLYYQTIKKLGFTKSGPHALRRHVGTEIAEKFGIEAARIHLGHADIKTTAGYVKVRQEMREEVAQSIADSINFG